MLRPGDKPTGDPDGHYNPHVEYTIIADRVVEFPRRPRGFTDAEIERVLASILSSAPYQT